MTRANWPVPHLLTRTIIGGVVCMLAITLMAAWWVPSPARAVDEPQSDAAQISLTDFTPTAPNRRSTLVISGRVDNVGTLDLSELSVRITISPEPLTSRAAIGEVAGGANIYDGFALGGTTTNLTDVLAPGQSKNFRLRIPITEIPLPRSGVYVLGVQLVGVDPNVGYAVLASARTFLPWVPDVPDAPLKIVWLWPLSTWPGRAADGVLLGDLLPREISAGGRLDRLLNIGSQSNDAISWVVDPALLQTVAAMESGYVVDTDGQLQPGTQEQSARAWHDRLKAVGSTSPVWTLPYADVDAEALLRGGLERDVVRAITTAPVTTRLSSGITPTGTMYWAPSGRLEAGTLNVLASAGVSTVVLRSGALPPQPPTDFTPSGSVDIDTQFGPIRAAVIDSGLAAVLRMPQGNAAEILLAQQRFISETAFISLEDPGLERTLVIGPGDPQWRGSPRLLRGLLSSIQLSPWTTSLGFKDLLSAPPSAVPRALNGYGTAQRDRELTTTYVARIVAAQESLGVLRSVLANPVDITEPTAAALLRSGSAAWRTRPENGNRLLDSVQASLDSDIARITVVSKGPVIFSGDTGRVPITVANDFDRTITVGLRLAGQPAARLVAEELPTVEIEAGRRASLEIPVRIVGGEPLSVIVDILTPTGQTFGESSTLTLQTTAYSRAALWVSIGAAVVLLLLVIADTWRRARQRRAHQNEPSTERPA